MIRTNKYRLPYFIDGDFYSGSIDAQRFIAIDLMLAGLGDIVGDGIIDGLEISDAGGLQILVSPGSAFINSFYSRLTGSELGLLSDDSTNYIYAMRNINVVDGQSEPSNRQTVSFIDVIPPAIPNNFQAVSIGERTVTLNWDKNVEPDLSHYLLQRKTTASLIYNEIARLESFEDDAGVFIYIDDSLFPDVSYDYRLIAVDLSDNESLPSDITFSTLVDTTPPDNISNLIVGPSDGRINISWNKSKSTDLNHYNVVVSELDENGVAINTSVFDVGKELFYSADGLSNFTDYRITVQSVDDTGNVSNGIQSIATPEVSPDDVLDVSNVSYTITNQGFPDPSTPLIALDWDASTSPNITGYEIVVVDLEDNLTSLNIAAGTFTNFNLNFYPVRDGLVITNKTFKSRRAYTIRIRTLNSFGDRSVGYLLKIEIPNLIPPPSVKNLIVDSSSTALTASWAQADFEDFSHYEAYIWKSSDEPSIRETIGYSSFSGSAFTLGDEMMLPLIAVNSYPTGSWVDLNDLTQSGGPRLKLLVNSPVSSGDGIVNVASAIPNYYDSVAEIILTNPPAPEILDQKTFVFSGLDNGTEYRVTVLTVNKEGDKSLSSSRLAIPSAVSFVAETPQGVEVIGGDSTITINWQEVIPTLGYNIYKATVPLDSTFVFNESLFSLYATINNGSEIQYIDFDQQNELRQAYIVTSFSGSEESPIILDNQVLGTASSSVDLAPPDNLTASVVGDQVNLDWDLPGDITGIEGWKIYRSTSETASFELLADIPFSFTSYIDTGLTSGFNYTYFLISFSNTIDIDVSLSPVVPDDSILLGTVITESGAVTSITPNDQIVGGLQTAIEEVTGDFIKNHLHQTVLSDEFSSSRVDPLQVNLSKDEILTDLTTTDFQTYTTERDLTNGVVYVPLVNGSLINILWDIDLNSNSVVFGQPLFDSNATTFSNPPFEIAPTVTLKAIGLQEVMGELDSNLISNLDATKIATGKLNKFLLPKISHKGRVKECADISNFQLISKDNIFYDLSEVTYLGDELTDTDGEVVVDANGDPVREPIKLQLGASTVFYDVIIVDGIVYGASNRGILRSLDNGILWEDFTSFNDEPAKIFFKSELPGGATTYYVVTQRKVFVSVDNFITFSEITGLSSVSTIHDITEDDDNNIYIATDIGMFVYDLSANIKFNFTSANYILDGVTTTDFVSIIKTNSNSIVVSNSEGVYSTSDKGQSWIPLTKLSTFYKMRRFLNSIVAVKNDGFLWRSLNEGITWSRLSFVRGVSKTAAIEVIDGRLYFSTDRNILYTDNLVNSFEVPGEFNKLNSFQSPQSIYAVSKNDIFISFDNSLYKFINGDTHLWASFTGTIPTIFKNGIIVKDGYYYDSINNNVLFEYRNDASDVFAISTEYYNYQLIARGWQDIDEPEGEVKCFLNNEQLVSITTDEDGNVVITDSIISDEVPAEDIETETTTDDDGNEVLTIVNKKYIFTQQSTGLVITINSSDGSVTTSDTLNKFDQIKISILNVSLLNEGVNDHEALQDLLSKSDIGFDFDLSNVYLENLLQFSLSIEHNFLEQVSQLYPYALNSVVRSFNSHLINSDFFIFGRKQYDVFNSTVDYSLEAVNDMFTPSSLQINKIKEINGFTWLLTSSNIYELDETRSFVGREVFVLPNQFMNITDAILVNNIIYTLANNDVYTSIDNGNTWNLNQGFGLPSRLLSISTLNNLLMLGTNDSIYYSEFESETWVKAQISDINGNILTISSNVFSLISDDIGYALLDNRVFKSNSASSWVEVYDFDGLDVVASKLFAYKNTILAITDNGLYTDNSTIRTLNNTATFSAVLVDGISSTTPMRDIDGFGDVLLLVNSKNIYTSLDSGEIFTKEIISDSFSFDICHFWKVFGLTQSRIDFLETSSGLDCNLAIDNTVSSGLLTCAIITALRTIEDQVFFSEEEYRQAIEGILTTEEIRNFQDSLFTENVFVNEQTEIFSFLNNVYHRDSLSNVEFLLNVDRADYSYSNTLEQSIEVQGDISKISLYLSPYKLTGNNFDIRLNVYGGDSSGNIITGILDSDTIGSNRIIGPAWYNFRISVTNTDPTLVLELSQTLGDSNNTIKWKYTFDNSLILGKKNSSNVPYSYSYQIWSYEPFVDEDMQILNTRPALQRVESPEFIGGTFDKTKLESDTVQLDLNPALINFDIDLSGSMTWNDHERERFELVRRYTGRLNDFYPGELSYTLSTFGGLVIESLIIEDTSNSDDRLGVVFRLVRRDDTYPLDPEDGEVIGCIDPLDLLCGTTLTTLQDDDVVSGTTYFYSLFNMRTETSYSDPVHAEMKASPRIIPLPVSAVDSQVIDIQQTIGAPSALVDVGLRQVTLEYYPIINFSSFYNEVRIIRKPCFEEGDKIANHTDGDIIFEGPITVGQNILIDDFGGTNDFINGIEYCYAIYTKNIQGNFCLPQNSVNIKVRIPQTWREWEFDSSFNASHIPSEFLDVPLDPINVSVEAGNGQNRLTWEEPSTAPSGYIVYTNIANSEQAASKDLNVDGLAVSLLYAEVPDDSITKTAGSSSKDFLEQAAVEQIIYLGTDTEFIHRDLENGVDYQYRIFSFNRVFTLSEGKSVGSANPSDLIVDDFKPPKPTDFYAQIFNSEKIVLRWNAEAPTNEVELFYDDFSSMRSFALDQFGIPLPEIEKFNFQLLPSKWTVPGGQTPKGGQITIEGTVFTLQETDLLGVTRNDSNRKVEANKDLFKFSVDKSTLTNEINANIELIGSSAELSLYTNLSFRTNVFFRVANPDSSTSDKDTSQEGVVITTASLQEKELKETDFVINSEVLTINFRNPLEMGHFNIAPDTQVVARKIVSYDSTTGESSESVDYLSGVYVRTGQSYFGIIEVYWKNHILTDEQIENANVTIVVFDKIRDNVTNGVATPVFSSQASTKITPVTASLSLDNQSITRQFNTGNSESENTSEEQSSSQLTTVAEYELSASDDPIVVRVAAIIEVDGYIMRRDIIVNYETVLQIDIAVSSPKSDGIDVTEQEADIYLGPPKFDAKSDAERVPIRDGVIVKWKKTKKQRTVIKGFSKVTDTSDRPFYSTDIVPLQDGVYSLTRQGVARNVFFGPANDVVIGFCFEEGTEIPCFEQYTIQASVVFEGLVSSNEGVISLSPNDSSNKYKFYMTNGGDSEFSLASSALETVAIPTVFADGESVVNIKIYADPLDGNSGAGDPGLYFVQCLSDKNLLYIPLREGQEVLLKSPDSAFGSDGEETSIITYNGVDYPSSTIGDVDTVITDGVLEYQFRINKFIEEDCEEEEGGEELPIANQGCYGIYQPPVIDEAGGEIAFSASSIISINGNNVKTRAGGDKETGFPPVIVKLQEPLDIRFVEMRASGLPISSPPNNGADGTELIFEVSFSGEPIPDGVLVAFEVFSQAIADPNCPDEQAESLDQFADFSTAQIREFLGGFTSIAELLEQLRFERFSLTRTVNGKSIVSTTIQPTLFKTDLSLSFVASCTYDKLGTVDRLKKASAILQFQTSPFNVYLNHVERYDVISDTWTEIDSFNVERAGHFSAYDSVTGRLYIGGGLTLIGLSSSVEEFTYDNLDKSQNMDGTYGKWRFQDPMNHARGYSSSVTIGQKIYVLGGYGLKSGTLGAVSISEVYNISEDENESSSSSASSSSTEVSSVSSSSSNATSSSSSSQSSSSSSSSSDSSDSSSSDSSSESSSSQSQDSLSSESSMSSSSSSDGDPWDDIASMPRNVSHGVAVNIGTNIYVLSGIQSFTKNANTNETVVKEYNNAILKYDTLTNEWKTLVDLGANSVLERISPNAYVFGGKIYLLSGVDGIFDPGNIDEDIFNDSLIEIDVSDENNIIITEVADVNLPIDRYRAVSGVLNDELFIVSGSGYKTVDNNGFIDLRASNTLSELEILDLNTNTWNTYKNLERSQVARYAAAGAVDDEFFYLLGGAGTGWPKGKFFLDIELSSNTLRADGQQQISVSVNAHDETGEPPPDGVKVLLRGFVFIQPPESDSASTVSDPFSQASTTSLITSFADVVRKEQNSSNRLVDRISIYPVLFSANEGGFLDGKAPFVLFERGEDPLNGLNDLLAFREGGDEVVGLIFDPETGDILLPADEPTALVPGQKRDLYKIIVEATIDDPVFFGQTNTDEALAALDSRLQEQIFDEGFTDPTTSSNLVGAQPQTQSPSPTVDVYSDILWIPHVDSSYPVMNFSDFDATINLLSESFPIGGSPLWDSLVNSSVKLKEQSLIDIPKIMLTASDNEQNNFTNSFDDSLQSVQTIDGFGNTPVFNTSFIINFPPSLSARNGIASTTELETLSTSTGGSSFTLLDAGFINPVVFKITSDGVGSIGRGTYTQTIDFGESVLITSIFADFDIFPGTGGGVFISYSEDGYNYVKLQESIKPNLETEVEMPCMVRYLRYEAFLQTLFNNPISGLPTPPPIFNSITFEFSKNTVSYLYTNTIQANSWLRELYVTTNASVPECSSIKIGMLHANYFNFNSYDTISQPAVEQKGRIVVVDSAIRSIQLIGDITEGGNVAGSSNTYEEIKKDFIKSIEVLTGRQVLSISVIDSVVVDSNGSVTDTGKTLVVFVDESEVIVNSAPNYNEASDLVDVTGANPTANVTEGTVLVYNFMTSKDGFVFTTTYGEWTPGAIANVYINGLIIDPLQYVAFPSEGIVRFNNIQNPSDNYALEVIFPPEFRIGFKISNGDHRQSAVLDEFAYVYNTQFLSKSQFQNSPPQASVLFVTPTNSNKFDTFKANYTYKSDNNRPEKGSEIVWFLNDGVAGELKNKVSWSGDDLVGKELKDGDRVYFTVVPSDGEQLGAKVVSTSIALGVTPPTISDTSFTFFQNGVQRSGPTSSTNVTINYVYSDDQGRPEFGTTTQWYVNDEFIDFGVSNKQTLGASEEFPASSSQEGLVMERGNLIYAIVTISNGLTTAQPATIDTITVLNSAPVVRNVVLNPDVATINAVVTLSYSFFDSDNDEDQSNIKWYKNGIVQPQLDDLSQVSSSNLTPGDIWFAEVEPFDGIDAGIKVRTNTIRIV